MDERETGGRGTRDDTATPASGVIVGDGVGDGVGADVETGVTEKPDPEARLRAREAQLRAYARLLDSAVRLPGGFRVGLDGLVGLVPGVGDLVGAGLSGYLVVAAARLGIPRAVVARMVANVAIETVVGAVPLVGDVFDFVFKANERNARLLHRELERRDAERAHRESGHGSGRALPDAR